MCFTYSYLNLKNYVFIQRPIYGDFLDIPLSLNFIFIFFDILANFWVGLCSDKSFISIDINQWGKYYENIMMHGQNIMILRCG